MTPQNDVMSQLAELTTRLQTLEENFRTHGHDGTQYSRINFDDVIGGFEIVDAAPTGTPNGDIFSQIKIYKNGTTYRLYWHDGTDWRYATGT